jgi:hypothetical protein
MPTTKSNSLGIIKLRYTAFSLKALIDKTPSLTGPDHAALMNSAKALDEAVETVAKEMELKVKFAGLLNSQKRKKRIS